MNSCVRRIIKAAVFTLISAAILCLLSFIAQPVWNAYNYNSTYGFYEEPENTIETLFVGSSHVRSGITTMELYENYGICAYSIVTDSQPMEASYFWNEEVFRLHPETLDTVVLDVEKRRYGDYDAPFRKAIEPMHFSMVKVRAIKAYSDNFTDFIYNMVPLFSYHERWKELSEDDFTNFNLQPTVCLRGYTYSTAPWIDTADSFADISLPTRILDEDAEETVMNDGSSYYFEKIVSFCAAHDLQLLLIKTPTDWSSGDHNAVQALADRYGLEFIDFNFDPWYTDSGLNIAEDMIDPVDTAILHANFFGAQKITDCLGKLLINEYGNRDVRGDEKYAYMNEELEDYLRYTASTAVLQYTDPCDYIRYALDQGDYTIFLSADGDAAAALTDDQRAYFASVGLVGLSGLMVAAPYLAVIDDGKIVAELSGEDADDGDLQFAGTLPDETSYSMQSGESNSSVIIDGTERSNESSGIHIVL